MFFLYIFFTVSLVAYLLSCVIKLRANEISPIALLYIIGQNLPFFHKYNCNSKDTCVLTSSSYPFNQSSECQKIKYLLLNDTLNVGNIDAHLSNICTDQYSGVPIHKILQYYYLFVEIQISIEGLNNLLVFRL